MLTTKQAAQYRAYRRMGIPAQHAIQEARKYLDLDYADDGSTAYVRIDGWRVWYRFEPDDDPCIGDENPEEYEYTAVVVEARKGAHIGYASLGGIDTPRYWTGYRAQAHFNAAFAYDLAHEAIDEARRDTYRTA